VLRRIEGDGRPATADEQAVLARWSSWGALPEMFGEGAGGRWAELRGELRLLVDDDAWRAAERTTINAHYTPASVAAAMWGAARRLGFDGGLVLEPGAGAGVMMGTAPAGLPVEMVGVELDPTTAAIAAALYPHARIRNESFADTRLPEGRFDLAIGNVPFGDVTLHDPRHNRSRHSLHNHFLVKSLHLVRPGGLVVALTSRFTLDARNPAARREMAEMADLVGAVRLPEGAFRAVAGTDVVIDLLVLRRRLDGEARRGPAWERSVEVATGDGPVAVNEVLAAHPQWVLGELGCRHGQYNDRDLTVRPRPGEPLAPQLEAVLGEITAAAHADGLVVTARPAGEVVPIGRAPAVTVGPDHKEGSLLVTATGLFARVEGGVAVRFQPDPKNGAAELRAVIAVRDALHEVLAAQAASVDDPAWEAARHRLNVAYDSYAYRYGPLNRFTLQRTGRTHPETGEPTYRRMTPKMGGFKADPDLPSVLALEMFDADTGHAAKAAIFERRVLEPRQRRLGADTAEDALAICLDERGHPDVDHIASLLGVEAAEARERLGQLVFDDPADGHLVTAATYLSGNVRAKLAAATEAAAGDPRWQGNVDALAAVQPDDLGPGEIDAHLGAPWIPATDVADFAHEVLDCPGALVDYEPLLGWTATAPGWQRHSVAATSEWGTARADAVTLLQAACNQSSPTVYDHHSDGTRTTNTAETLAAREKVEAITVRFGQWLWEDPQRAERLGRAYNETFNATVAPAYHGGHLSVPGMSAAFTPRQHQLDAAWRMMSEPTVLLGHFVGAGKTSTMIIGGREMKRLGLISKPSYVVPGHMLEQFSREYLQLFPAARVLVASKDDVDPAHRKNFVARAATGDWDAVIMTRSSFELIPVSVEARTRFLADKIATYRSAIEAAEGRGGLSVKQLQKGMLKVEEKHRALLASDRKDDGVSFEATGIDYLAIDEAHYYKSLFHTSRIPGAGHQGSRRAEDLAMKLAVLRDRHGSRVCTFATATPIANSIAEMWVMQSFLQPDALEAAGLASFDGWAATFGRTVTALELSPDGSSYRMSSRFARFANVPELLTMFGAVADLRTRDQLPMDIPTAAGGGPETVVVAPGDGLRQYMAELVERAREVRNHAVKPDVDNMLSIGNDGRAAALDLRLVGRAPDPTGGKIAVAADRIAALWAEGKDRIYLGADGRPSPRPGTLQLVFCDLGVPHKGGGWSVYQELRWRLHAAGIPEGQVRFIHDARNDKAKGELFAACRDGRVSVLIGSTEKMGVGVNVQSRVTAVHHLDCPWWPASIEQRDGRGQRQGNQNDEIRILRYAARGSFDVFTWETVQRKATFIDQVMRGDAVGRSIDDIGDAALSYAEVKALATGNPLIMERAGVASDLVRLERQLAAHNRDQGALMKSRAASERRAGHLRSTAASYRDADSRRQPTAGDRFAMVVAGARYHSRPDAGAALQHEVMARLDHMALGARAVTVVGHLGGLDVELNATRDPGGAYGELGFAGLPAWVVNFTRAELRDFSPGGLVSRLEHRLAALGERAQDAEQDADAAEREAARAAARIGAPFDQLDRIAELRTRLAEIDVALAELEDIDPPADTASETRTVSYQDLPEDMQVLIADLCGRVDDLDESRLTFKVFALDISAFPVVDVENDPQDTRYLADYLGVPMDCFPPVVVVGEYWLDGRHRVAAARAQGIETIDAIDVTSLVVDDVQLQKLQGWNLGRLTHNPATEWAGGDSQVAVAGTAKSTATVIAGADAAADDQAADPTVSYRPRWPRPTRHHDRGDDIGL
jgi:N12 class adenine-specific DNA methylase